MYKNISLSDVVRVPNFDGSNLDEILFHMGMDVEKGYNSEIHTHRSLDDKVVTCTLYMGFERKDKTWVKSRHSSIEAVYASTNDRSLREELSGMNRRAGYMQKWEKEE